MQTRQQTKSKAITTTSSSLSQQNNKKVIKKKKFKQKEKTTKIQTQNELKLGIEENLSDKTKDQKQQDNDNNNKNIINNNNKLNSKEEKIRCGHGETPRFSSAFSERFLKYHDFEWGRPVYGDDRTLFELLNLQSAQAGLSWSTILNKRENYVQKFENFDIEKVSKFDEKKIEELLSPDSGIIRNKSKISAAIENAKQILKIQNEFGSFSNYLWGFMPDKKPLNNSWKSMGELPSKTDLSEKISKDLKKRGFRFVGPTICYSFMQGAGLINDHMVDCFCYDEIIKQQKELFGKK